MEEGFVAVCTTVNRHQHSSLMTKLPASPAPVEIPEEPAAVEPPPVVAAEVFSLLLHMFSGFFRFTTCFISPLVFFGFWLVSSLRSLCLFSLLFTGFRFCRLA